MCGISFILEGKPLHCAPDGQALVAIAELQALLQHRGPDSFGQYELPTNFRCTLLGTVLHMRGPNVVSQPLVDETTGCALLWNGEVFGGSLDILPDQNDTQEVLKALAQTENIMEVLERIEGPFAFVFWQPSTQSLWFGRDKLGRRSLVMHYTQTDEACQLVISSVAVPTTDASGALAQWQEVPVNAIFSIPVNAEPDNIVEHPWTSPLAVIHPSEIPDSCGFDEAVFLYLDALSDAVRVRVVDLPAPLPMVTPDIDEEPTGATVAVLFSGGIDSMLLAALAHRHVPSYLPIDLLNVAFGEYPAETPDRIGSINGLAELRHIAPHRQWNLVEVDLSAEEAEKSMAHIVHLIHPCNTVMDLNIGTALWTAAKGVGHISLVDAQPIVASRVVRYNADEVTESTPLPTAVSDAAHFIPEDFRPLCEALWTLSATSSNIDGDHVRLSMLGGPEWPLPWKELGFRKMKLYVKAARDAGLVEMGPDGDTMPWCRLTDAVRQKFSECRAPRIERTVKRVFSTARALLLGIGADETLAGYGRHRTTFLRGGLAALVAELEMDFGRLWRRNLGRDDRVISDQGKECRLPYLDESVLDVIRSLPLNLCCNLAEPLGVGDKKLLRCAARKMGLTHSTGLQKRAIQFGTRIANRRLDGSRKLDGTESLDCLNPRVCNR